MRKKIVLYILSLLVMIVSCNNINEEDLIGTYVESHECFKDSIWTLPNGVFMQKVYGRNGSLIYDQKSTWRFNCGQLSISYQLIISILFRLRAKIVTRYTLMNYRVDLQV